MSGALGGYVVKTQAMWFTIYSYLYIQCVLLESDQGKENDTMDCSAFIVFTMVLPDKTSTSLTGNTKVVSLTFVNVI